MEDQEVKWFYGGGEEQTAQSSAKPLPYVGTWNSFNKLPEEEKAKLFNALRGACIVAGLMENK